MFSSNARSPLLSHVNAVLHGLGKYTLCLHLVFSETCIFKQVSIRAYRAQQAFRQESLKRIDHYTRIARTSWNLNRWIGIRIELLGAMFVALLAFYQIYVQTPNAAKTGFSLNVAVGFCGTIFFLIRIYNIFEVESNRCDCLHLHLLSKTDDMGSLERIQGYLDIDHEPKASESGKPPASWPTSGDLRAENLSARYSAVRTE